MAPCAVALFIIHGLTPKVRIFPSSPGRGQVGAVVEQLGPDVFEVEFSNNRGRTYATAALRADQMIVLHYQPIKMP